jgi:hypothetical protein
MKIGAKVMASGCEGTIIQKRNDNYLIEWANGSQDWVPVSQITEVP